MARWHTSQTVQRLALLVWHHCAGAMQAIDLALIATMTG